MFICWRSPPWDNNYLSVSVWGSCRVTLTNCYCLFCLNENFLHRTAGWYTCIHLYTPVHLNTPPTLVYTCRAAVLTIYSKLLAVNKSVNKWNRTRVGYILFSVYNVCFTFTLWRENHITFLSTTSTFTSHKLSKTIQPNARRFCRNIWEINYKLATTCVISTS